MITGTTVWRTLIPACLVTQVPDILPSTTWWHGITGHVHFSPVDDPREKNPEEEMLEIAGRYVIDPGTDLKKRFSWGVPATNEKVESYFKVRFAFSS